MGTPLDKTTRTWPIRDAGICGQSAYRLISQSWHMVQSAKLMGYKELFLLELGEIKRLITEGAASVCVIGVGRVGLPTALLFARSGFRTIGVDINGELVDKIKNRDFPLGDEPGCREIFEQVVDSGNLAATTKIEDAVPYSQIIVLSLPTPMDQNNVPDYTALRTVGAQLKDLVKPGSIVVVESTIEPGFIEDEFVGMIESGGRVKVGESVGVGTCPETANPGAIMRDFVRLPRLVGATNEKALQVIMAIYRHVFAVEMIRMPDCKTANAVKLTTNVFRDINIAFVNELAILFAKLGIDTRTVLEAAGRKYNFQIHYPGAGVGGPCLPVNSYQMLNSAKGIGGDLLKMVKLGRQINERMPHHVVDLLGDALSEGGRRIDSSEILILGISYKPNVKDMQLSPAKTVISELNRLGAKIRIYDPYFKNTVVSGIRTEADLNEVISRVDAAVIVTAHDEFKGIVLEYFAKMKTPILVDAGGIIDAYSAKKAGLTFRGLGRGSV